MAGGAWAECDRCGFRRRHAACSTEWTGAFVCSDCRDPRPPWLDPPYIDPMEGMPLPNARLEKTPVYIDAELAPILPEDL